MLVGTPSQQLLHDSEGGDRSEDGDEGGVSVSSSWSLKGCPPRQPGLEFYEQSHAALETHLLGSVVAILCDLFVDAPTLGIVLGLLHLACLHEHEPAQDKVSPREAKGDGCELLRVMRQHTPWSHPPLLPSYPHLTSI